MRRRSLKLILTTTAAVGVLGAGVAVAADPPTCPYGNTPQAGQVTNAQRSGDQLRLRKRDGTGPRHAQQQSRDRDRDRDCAGACGQQLRLRDGTGPRHS